MSTPSRIMKSQRTRRPNKRYQQDSDEEEDAPMQASEEDDDQPGPSKRASQPAQKKARAPKSQPMAQVQSDDLEDEPPTRPGPSQRQPPQQRAEARAPPAAGGNNAARAQIDQSELNSLRTKVRKYEEESGKKYEDAALVGSITNAELERVAGRVVRHMLFAHFEKPSHPVKRQALVDLVSEEYKGDRVSKKLPTVVIALAQSKLISVFGIEMREVERVTDASKKKEDAVGAKAYVLHSALPAALRNTYVVNGISDRGPNMALVMAVLAFIHLGGGKIDESQLYDNLEQLGVVRDQEHPAFGKVADEVKKLEDARYVMRSKKAQPVQGGEGVEHVYTWAEVAVEEIGEAGIKRYLDQEFVRFQERRQQAQGAQEGGIEVVELDSD